MSSFQSQSFMMLGAVVVGVVSAAGMIIAEHYRQERRRHAMAQDLDRLNQQISGLQGQLEILKKQHAAQPTSVDGRLKKRFRSRERTNSNITSTTDDYNSALDSSDMEFYDVSDEETSKASTLTPLDDVLKEIDRKLDDPTQVKKALTELEGLLYEYPSSVEVLWRLAKAHQLIAVDLLDAPAKMTHLDTGMDFCKQALELNPTGPGEVHKWFAVCLGARMPLMGMRDKMRGSVAFKKHIDLAVQMLPDDATCHFLLGRYVMEIASLKWYERKAAASIFDLPDASYQQALAELLQADRLAADADEWKINKLSIAKCHLALGDHKEALKWLDVAHGIQKVVVEEEGIEQEIEQLLAKYSGYR